MKAMLMPVDGKPELVDLDDSSQLAELQKFVGGYIEALTFRVQGREAVGWLNEEGKIQEPPLPYNQRATILARTYEAIMDGDYVAGPLIVTGFNPNNGENEDVPAWMIEHVEALGRVS